MSQQQQSPSMDDPMDGDADIEMNIDPAPPQSQPAAESEETEQDELLEAREPTKKDISLREFLSKMDDYAPIVC